MERLWVGGLAILAVGLVCVFGQAQQAASTPPPAPPTGTVTGHVTCSDTQREARFAQVYLLATEQPSYDETGKMKPTSAGAAMLGGRSGLDGSFTMNHVPVGDYYMLGIMAGYVVPLSPVANDEATFDFSKVMAGVPMIHVGANQTLVKDVELRRGAVITGRITYDDGTPAVGFGVKLQPAEGVNALEYGRYQMLSQIGYQTTYSQTDDAGRYRIAGVPPGKYRVMTQFIAEGGERWGNSGREDGASDGYQWLQLYGPGVFRAPDAKVVEVKGGDENIEMDIKVALNTTHTVSGHVMAKEDRHVPNHAYMSLTDKSDKTFQRGVSADATGAFHISYIPEGTYTLTSSWVVDGAPPEDPSNAYRFKTLARYEKVSVDVIVDQQDVIVDDMLLDKVKAETAKADTVSQ